MTEHTTDEWKHIKKKDCPHAKEIKKLKDPKKTKCIACSEKEHLRMCQTCGVVNCCESGNAHDTEHFKKSGHPFIKPYRCDYNWLWCYKCNAFLE